METLISIIIPVYNVEKYLQDCVDSVRKQTYKNLEIILIDDGSTDNSGKMCDEYKKQDARIKVFHKSNGGLSDARNLGLEKATGQYVYFLDSDDILPQCAIEILLYICLENKADVAIAGYEKFSNRIPQEVDTNKLEDSEVLDKIEAIRRMLLQNGFGHEAWGKLYKTKLWKCEHFPKGKLYEDYATTYRIINQCDKVAVLKGNLYWYRIRNGSIMKSKLNAKNMQLLDIAEEVTSYLKREIPELEYEACYLQMVIYLKLMKQILDNGFSSFKEEQKRIKKYIIYCKPLLKMSFAKKKDIVKAKSYLVSKYLFWVIYSIGEKTHL